MCAIPEPKRSGQQIATTCQTWNTTIQTACTALGPSVQFISTAAHLTEDHLNDIRYSEQAADQVGNQLSEAIKSFLWDKQQLAHNAGYDQQDQNKGQCKRY